MEYYTSIMPFLTHTRTVLISEKDSLSYGLDRKHPLKAHVLKAWPPKQQCLEVGLWSPDLINGLIH